MSIVNKSNSYAMHEAHKMKVGIRRIKHNEVNFGVTLEGPPKYSKTYML